jgi:peptidoglycan/LPS O-acetylase OafA/YrhL
VIDRMSPSEVIMHAVDPANVSRLSLRDRVCRSRSFHIALINPIWAFTVRSLGDREPRAWFMKSGDTAGSLLDFTALTRSQTDGTMLGSAGNGTSEVQHEHSDSKLSVITISDAETSASTADSEDQTFVGHAHASTKSLAERVPDAKPAKTNAPPTKVLFLDGIRGLAAILVVIQHSHEYPTQGLNLGSVAVDAFFVLSSFLLTWLFMKKSIKLLAQGASARTWLIALVDYFQKRFFRVYPLFAVTAIVLSFLSFEDQHRYFRLRKPEDFELSKVLAFHTGFRPHVFWTLPLEIGYYFVIPGFVMATLALRRFWWLGAAPLAVWVVHEGFYVYRNNHMPLAPHLQTFMAGSLGAVAFVKLDLWIKKTDFSFRWWHTLLLRAIEGLVIALMLSVTFQGLFFDWVHEDPVPAAPGFSFVSAQMATVFVIEMIRPSCISAMFEWSVLRYWGKIGFSVYLLHSFVVDYPPVSHQKKYFNRLFARFALILLLATASYHLIEYPSQLLAQRISRFLAGQEAKVSGAGLVRFTCMERINRRKQRVPVEEK